MLDSRSPGFIAREDIAVVLGEEAQDEIVEVGHCDI
jgi:hypothetical protein